MQFQFGAFLIISGVQISTTLAACSCKNTYSPVCGSNGVTYKNRCRLRCAAAKVPPLGEPITIAKFGICDKKQDDTYNCVCPIIGRPVCGSDGKTYSNKCWLKCEAKSNKNVVFKYGGVCRNSEIQDSKACSCNHDRSPVCGTDGRTYENRCWLECVAKANIERLYLKHKGPCKSYISSDYGICKCQNIDEDEPLCGTDGKTYKNECYLDCAAVFDKYLGVGYEGPCEFDEEPLSFCKCNSKYAPVCGSDDNTYDSKCKLKCAAKRKRGLYIKSKGHCRIPLRMPFSI